MEVVILEPANTMHYKEGFGRCSGSWHQQKTPLYNNLVLAVCITFSMQRIETLYFPSRNNENVSVPFSEVIVDYSHSIPSNASESRCYHGTDGNGWK